MNKYYIQVKMIKDARKYIKEKIKQKEGDVEYYCRLKQTKGSDKKWCIDRLAKIINEKQWLEYTDYILKFNEEIFEEIIKENNLEENTQLCI